MPVTALVVSLLAASCSGSAESAAQRLRNHVASEVHGVLNRHGVPVESGVLSCEGPAPDGSVDCEATTAYEPQAEVGARFTAPAGLSGHPTCAGTLQITVGGAPLATAREDPCR